MHNFIEQKNHVNIIVEIEILPLSKDYGFGLIARS